MGRLQATCAEIPALTSATKELHKSVTSLVIEAHSLQQQQGGAAAAPPRTAGMQGSRPATASAVMMVGEAGRCRL